VQYEGLREGASFLRDRSTLTPYDPDAVRLALTLRHRGVEALEASLNEARSEADAHRRDREQRAQELAHTQSTLAEMKIELADAEAALAARTAELDIRTGELVAKTGALEARTAEANALRRTLDERLDEIERWRAAVDDQARRLDALHDSLSWRWTAPARAVFRLVRGR
jgi:chromosome segregation ATPase